MTAKSEAGATAAPPREFPPKWVGGTLDRAFGAIPGVAFLAAGALSGRFLVKVANERTDQELLATLASWLPSSCQPAWAAAACCALGLLLFLALSWRTKPIYLLDFACYRPPNDLKVTYTRFMQGSRDSGFFDDEALDFQRRILEKSALSEETFFPRGLHSDPPEVTMETAREEAEHAFEACIQDALERTGLKPKDIDVLVTNCSLFNPTPSLAAMVINKFKMRSDIDSYNLAGMGCSAGVLAIGLATKLLRERKRGGYALVVSTENITQNWYRGRERSMLIPNTIFRLGAAAIVLTSKGSERKRSKYELEHIVRVHLGRDEPAYRCIFQEPDSQGRMGVALSKDIVHVAAKALTTNLTRLGPLVLPWSEKLMFAANWVARFFKGKEAIAAYVPDFTKAFDHFCLHAGGRGVVEGLSKQLGLSLKQMAPSANTLYWYGNTSSSTIWYSFGYCEAVPGVQRGERVWQVAFGSGFKCNSAVWRALRPVHDTTHAAWKHIEGREDEAIRTLLTISEASKAEREASKKAANGHANGQEETKRNGATHKDHERDVEAKQNGHVEGSAHGEVERRITRAQAKKVAVTA
ncbi:hypothetical protein QBZ16_003723 [Prototheca wickerhamii]|uniref:very-long-chain 3-oxoacyl-CoA synthase n=1 Tax=Prototheca wickerhamii TaxID=3111 RepID=A0AAD9IJN2_PROWI|nr:hypothetical protein QBZ16_003723 [Prototheca wickerhamii]